MGLYRRGKTWWMSYVVNGRQKRESTGTKKRQSAELIYGKILVDIKEKRYFEEAKEIKMTEVIEKYMTETSPLKQGSHERNQQIADHFKVFFGDTLLEDVKPALLSNYKAQRLQTKSKRGGHISPATVRKELSVLRQIFNVAIDEWEYCRENPVRKVIRSLPREEKRVRYVLPEEAEKLKFTIPAWLKPLVITACQTGLRRGDLLKLTVHQVNFSSNRIVVDKTKNGDPIGIVMTSIVRETLLDGMRKRTVISPYVFCDDRGKPYSPFKVSMAFRRACKRARVENLRLHDLRHDFATLMLNKTRSLVDVQHSLGHRDPRMTLRYAHLMPDGLKEAFKAIDNAGTASILSQSITIGNVKAV
jgi:integrase